MLLHAEQFRARQLLAGLQSHAHGTTVQVEKLNLSNAGTNSPNNANFAAVFYKIRKGLFCLSPVL
jgi:hypothetical protein